MYFPLVGTNNGRVIYPAIDICLHDLVYEGPDEYIQIRNGGTETQTVPFWFIQSVVGNQVYRLTGCLLGAGASVYVHSGPEATVAPPIHLLWGYDEIWDDSGDAAVIQQGALRN